MEELAPAPDAVNAPLGQAPRRGRRLAIPRFIPMALAAGLGSLLLGFGAWVAAVDNPLGGEPVAIVASKAQPKPEAANAGADASRHAGGSPMEKPSDAPGAGVQTVTIIDGMSGNRQQVTIGGPAAAPGKPKQAPPPAAAPAAAVPVGPAEKASDSPLAELSRHGLIPKVAANGARPSEAHAGRVDPAARGAARVAIVVGRLGISASATAEALAKLPGPVTLAFTPYGADLDRWVARARGEGHEVLLQVPMEPFDYPDNDPGPRTLLTSLSPDQNIDRLHWAMSRFQGYVGLTNYMGARLVADEPAMTALLREAGKRGLLYVDDGAARSHAGQIAGTSGVPFARADIAIDATPNSAEIDKALARLERLARERGFAVGSATALPVSIERIAAWAKAAEGRGVVLVPVTAVASKPKERVANSK